VVQIAQPFLLPSKTDANGLIPHRRNRAGYYVIVAETGTGWAQLTDQFGMISEWTLIQAGEQYDIETLTLEE